jgi:hypothetical protein
VWCGGKNKLEWEGKKEIEKKNVEIRVRRKKMKGRISE